MALKFKFTPADITLPVILAQSARLFSLVLLGLIAYLLAELSWQLWSSYSKPLPSAQAPAVKRQLAQAPNNTQQYIQRLQSLSIFGHSDAPSDLSPAIENAEETRLSLVLNGVLPSSDKTQAKALISYRGELSSYKSGDKLPLSAKVQLEQVFADRVVLVNGGNFETLWLNQQLKEKALKKKQQSKRSVSSPGRSHSDTQPTHLDPTTGFKIINVSQGIAVSAGKNPQLFKLLGLQDGDIIQSIEGKTLDAGYSIDSIYQQLLNKPNITLQIRRQGKGIDLPISAKSILR